MAAPPKITPPAKGEYSAARAQPADAMVGGHATIASASVAAPPPSMATPLPNSLLSDKPQALGGVISARVAVIGCGLIGASVAAGVKQAGLAETVVGYDLNEGETATGLAQGVLDEAAPSVAAAAAGAGLVVVAVPVDASEAVFKEIDPSGKIVTDVGSVKAGVVAAAKRAWGSLPPGFVPGHPIAGSEKQGAGHRVKDLFKGRRVILTPTASTDEVALAQVTRLWTALGAWVSQLSPEQHDQLLARTSHLPHLLAYALVDALADEDERLDIFQYAAGGFRDFTRIASSDPVIWRDICKLNQQQLTAALASYTSKLQEIQSLLEKGDFAKLETLFKRAKVARDRFMAMTSMAGPPTGDSAGAALGSPTPPQGGSDKNAASGYATSASLSASTEAQRPPIKEAATAAASLHNSPRRGGVRQRKALAGGGARDAASTSKTGQ